VLVESKGALMLCCVDVYEEMTREDSKTDVNNNNLNPRWDGKLIWK